MSASAHLPTRRPSIKFFVVLIPEYNFTLSIVLFFRRISVKFMPPWPVQGRDQNLRYDIGKHNCIAVRYECLLR